MTYRFKKHYTIEEARAMLPQIREWLRKLSELREEVERGEKRLQGLMAPGADLGGEIVNCRIRAMVRSREILMEFYEREIQIKDFERGLVDFPAIIGVKEVFLCWELSEDDIEFWHELDAGFSGREHV